MEWNHDTKALYIWLGEGKPTKLHSVEIGGFGRGTIVADIDAQGWLIGIEVVGLIKEAPPGQARGKE